MVLIPLYKEVKGDMDWHWHWNLAVVNMNAKEDTQYRSKCVRLTEFTRKVSCCWYSAHVYRDPRGEYWLHWDSQGSSTVRGLCFSFPTPYSDGPGWCYNRTIGCQCWESTRIHLWNLSLSALFFGRNLSCAGHPNGQRKQVTRGHWKNSR